MFSSALAEAIYLNQLGVFYWDKFVNIVTYKEKRRSLHMQPFSNFKVVWWEVTNQVIEEGSECFEV